MVKENKQNQSQPQPSSGGNNRTLIVVLIVVGVLIVLGVIGSYVWGRVWSNVGENVAENVAEKAIEQSTGGDADVNFNDNEWPSNLDSNLQYPGSTVGSSSSYETGGEESTTVSLTSTDNVSDIYDYFLGLEDSGWKVSYKFKSSRSDVGESASVSITKGDWSVAVKTNAQEDDGNNLITILATRGSN